MPSAQGKQLGALLRRPRFAVGTIAAIGLAVVCHASSIAFGPYHLSVIPAWVCMCLSTFACYTSFTVVHESVHRNVSTSSFINDLIGYLAAFMLGPSSAFYVFRDVHIQHHKHTNQSFASDPDHWCTNEYTNEPNLISLAKALSLPFRWATLDIGYVIWYIKGVVSGSRPQPLWVTVTLCAHIAFSVWLSSIGNTQISFHYLYPSRFAVFFLGFLFDWLPHQATLTVPIDQSRAHTTNRIMISPSSWARNYSVASLAQGVLTFFLFFQDYHVVHHLYPTIPFYRYVKAWAVTKKGLLAKKIPTLCFFGELQDESTNAAATQRWQKKA